MITVVTSVYGDDALVDPPVQDTPCEWVCVSDRPRESDVWNVVVEPRPHLHPRFAAKVAKYRPDLYANSPVTLWIDGSVRLRRDDAVRRLALSQMGVADIAMLPHPDRSSIEEEAPCAAAQTHYAGQEIMAQAASYVRQMECADTTLWATTIIARYDVLEVRQWGDEILRECARWSLHDPLAVPFITWKNQMWIAAIPQHLWTTEFFTLWQRPISSS